jgi:adenylate kinase
MARIILLGAPGCGKGTVAGRLLAELGVPAISTGDIFRKNLSENTPLGLEAKGYMEKGGLVPDELVIALVADRLAQDDAKDGYLLDGFPRTIPQAEALDGILAESGASIDKVFYINVPRDVLISRIAGRRVCGECGKTYHVTNFPPKTEGVCDICGKELIQRKDDNEDTAATRIDVYDKETKPLADYYRAAGILVELDGTTGPDALKEAMLAELGISAPSGAES